MSNPNSFSHATSASTSAASSSPADKLVTIRYDPYRVVPPDDGYRFGDPERPVVSHLQFKEPGSVIDVTLVSSVGTPDYIPPTAYDVCPEATG